MHLPIHPRIAFWLPWLLFGLFAWLLLKTSWLCDDAYISFRYIENLIHGNGLTFNIHERVQGFTNPLWLFWNLPFRLITGEIFFSAHLTSILTSLGAMALLLWNRETPVLQRVLAGLLLCGSPAFVDYSTSGLENPLNHLLLALAFRELCFRESPRLFLISLYTSLMAVTRLDAVLFLGPALLWYSWKASGKTFQLRGWLPLIKPLFLGMLPLILWEIFALVYYGFPFPNTAYAKLGTGLNFWEYLSQGWRYFQDGLHHNWPIFSTVPLLVMLVWKWPQSGMRILSVGLVLYCLYILRIGGDFMSGRFFATPFFLAGLLLTRAAIPHALRLVPLFVGIALGLAVEGRFSPFSQKTSYSPAPNRPLINPFGIADERAYYYHGTGLMEYMQLDSAPPCLPFFPHLAAIKPVPSGNTLVQGEFNMGFLGYLGGPNLHLVDYIGLTDAWVARMDGAFDPHWRIGHTLRIVPEAYMASVRTGENQFSDPEMHRDYQDLRTIISGDLFSAERWAAIWRMNWKGGKLGSYRHRYRLPASDTLTVPALQAKLADTSRGTLAERAISLLGEKGLAIQRDGPAPKKIYLWINSHHTLIFAAAKKGQPLGGFEFKGAANTPEGFFEVNFDVPAKFQDADFYYLYNYYSSGEPTRLAMYREEF